MIMIESKIYLSTNFDKPVQIKFRMKIKKNL